MRFLYTLLAVGFFSTQSVLDLRPNENLYDYKARMEAYFAPKIAARDPELAAEGSEYNQYLQFMFFWEPRLHGHGDFQRYYRLQDNFYNHYGRVRRRVTLHGTGVSDADTIVNTAPWQELGPKTVPQAGLGIGPIEFLLFHPTSPSHMLCGSTAGGLFYSTDGASSWKNGGTDTAIGPSGVSSAAFHPTDFRTWFVSSSGNSNHNDAWPMGAVGGIFRTTDEGATWKQIATPADLGGLTTRIHKILINPSNANQLWAATSAGLYVTNTGLSNKPVWCNSIANCVAYDLEFRPGDPQWVYATISDSTDWRFVQSSDGGVTWNDVPNQPSTADARALTIEVTPAKPGNLYCLVVSKQTYSALYIYDYATHQAKLVSDKVEVVQGGGHAFGVDRFNASRMYVGFYINGVRYDDGVVPSSRIFNGTHVDFEDLISDPTVANRVWMCNHGGVAVSSDGGVSWIDRSNGLGVAQPLGMAESDADPRYVALGTYHDGNIITNSPWSDPWNPSWLRLSDGDGMRPMISPTGQYVWYSYYDYYGNRNVWYRSTQFTEKFLYNPPDSEWWSIGGGALSRKTPNIQFRIGTDQQLTRSSDWGNTWSGPLTDLFGQYTNYSDLKGIYTSQTNDNYVAVSLINMPNGTVMNFYAYRTKKANDPASAVRATWDKIPLPGTQQISDIEFDPDDPEIMYIALNASSADPSSVIGAGMIYRCTVQSCTDVTQNLPNATTGPDSLAMAADGSGGLYYACDFGVFYSNATTRAAGNGWRPLGGNLPHTNFNGIEINGVNKKLRVAANGRGAWEHDLVATIRGTLFHDLNHNGKRDAGEPPLIGWTVRLSAGVGTASAVTSADGQYTFSALAAGTYAISQGVSNGWTQTLPASGGQSVTVAAGDIRSGVDFGDDLLSLSRCFWPASDGTALWRLNETTGTTAYDFYGFDNAAQCVHGPQPTTGKVDHGLHFDGHTQYLEAASHPELNTGTRDFSIEAWIRTTSNDLMPIVDKRDAASIGYSFYLINGRLGFQMSDRGGSADCSLDNTASSCTNWGTTPGVVNLADGQWHHVAVTVDRDNPAGGLLYADGAIVLVFDPTIRGRSLANDAPLHIAMSENRSKFWNGDLDEIGLFSRSLNPYEVQSIYKADRFGICTGNECNPNCF